MAFRHPTKERVYIIDTGDSTTALAFEHGLFWKTVWDHAENSDLKQKRKQPNILAPGDELYIPEIKPREESCATEKRHRFRRKGVPEKLNLQILKLNGKPRANEPYRFVIDDVILREGKLDGEGKLSEFIPNNAKTGKLWLGEKYDDGPISLQLGNLDPVDTIRGVQHRLKNLGFWRGPINGEDDADLHKVVRKFRAQHKLAEVPEDQSPIDDEFRDKIKELHQS
jgi:hypothetical protein